MFNFLMAKNKVKFHDNGKEYDGNILSVNRKEEIITVCYSDGVKAKIGNMPFSHIIEVGN